MRTITNIDFHINGNTSFVSNSDLFCSTGLTKYCIIYIWFVTSQAGDELTVVERPCPDWNLREVIHARFNPRLDPAVAKALSELEELAEPWRVSFAKKADPAFQEDTSKRLNG